MTLICCKKLSSIDLEFPCFQNQRAVTQRAVSNLTWPKRQRPVRVRFLSQKPDQVIIENLNHIESHDAHLYENQNESSTSTNCLSSKSQELAFDIETIVVMNQNTRNGKMVKVVQFTTGENIQNCKIALLHRHDFGSYRRTSL